MPALMEKFRQDRLSIAEEVTKLSREVQSFLLDVKSGRQKQAQEQATALRQSFPKSSTGKPLVFNRYPKTAFSSSGKAKRGFTSISRTTFSGSETARQRLTSTASGSSQTAERGFKSIPRTAFSSSERAGERLTSTASRSS
uniref:Begining of Q70JU0_MICAE Gas vesicle structural protein n=1 Tax=Microcystis aeruginosa (strain PCC 7806) TaxID=267872 RepID=A8Y9U0_MICA7|nr:unnamed protein product [Microcystis aeruginosa PCC 7806]